MTNFVYTGRNLHAPEATLVCPQLFVPNRFSLFHSSKLLASDEDVIVLLSLYILSSEVRDFALVRYGQQ